MASKKIYDLAVKTGSYTNSMGETKNRWLNVGAVMQADDGGKFIMLQKTFNPAGVQDERGGESILLSMFEPKQRDQQPSQAAMAHEAQKPGTAASDVDDDVPF